jgi:hypothetical protein
VVAHKTSADLLSTVALALAVLSFAAQLIVSLAQGYSGAQQVAQVERVNTNTQSALQGLRAASDALLVTQREHFAQVLSAALRTAVPEAVEEATSGSDGEPTRTIDADDLARLESTLLRSLDSALRGTSGTPESRRGPTSAYRGLTEPLSPEEEESALDIVRDLNRWECGLLAGLFMRHREGHRTGRPGPNMYKVADWMNPAIAGLEQRGLLESRQMGSNRDGSMASFWISTRCLLAGRLLTSMRLSEAAIAVISNSMTV